MMKRFCCLLLVLFISCQMLGQVFPAAPLVVGILRATGSMPKQKIHVFKGSNFDSTYFLIGIPADTSPELEKFSFLTNSSADMQLLKKDWFVRDFSKSVLGQHLFKVYAIKDKAIKQEWNIFPLDSAIYTLEDYYRFDTSMLAKVALEHPLAYSVKIDSLDNYNEFIIFKKASQENELFLFLVEPTIGYEGNFEVKIEQGNEIISREEAADELQQYCSKVAGKSKYSIYTRNETNKGEGAGAPGFVIKADHEFYNRFNSKKITKGKWNNELLIVKSYWQKNKPPVFAYQGLFLIRN